MTFPLRVILRFLEHRVRLLTLAVVLSVISVCAAQSKPTPAAPNSAPDELVLSNGDTLHGKFVSESGGKVTFHSDPLGDVSITWDKVKELHASGKFGVLQNNVQLIGKRRIRQVPTGTIDMADQTVTVHAESAQALAPIPVKNAQFIFDEPTINKYVAHQPSFFQGWNGPATAGATLVTGTQNQYTFTGAIGLVRTSPTVSWLAPRDRTSMDFSGSYGKIIQPAYTSPGPPPATVAAVTTKTAIYHADAERDEYFSPRFFALGQTAFDHNFSQDLDLQQIYGGGIGWTVVKKSKQELDLKGTMQYEKQIFITGAAGTNQNLIGSTFSGTYTLQAKLFNLTQGVSFIPAYNDEKAYSANETDTFAFPAYKNFSFSVGTLDSYLNDPPVSLPPTKRNSFQFTFGLTYAIKSKY
jgi:hypothetical protein